MTRHMISLLYFPNSLILEVYLSHKAVNHAVIRNTECFKFCRRFNAGVKSVSGG
jgi:hypothetical protein